MLINVYINIWPSFSLVVILINENDFFCLCKVEKSIENHAIFDVSLVANFAIVHCIFVTFLAI